MGIVLHGVVAGFAALIWDIPLGSVWISCIVWLGIIGWEGRKLMDYRGYDVMMRLIGLGKFGLDSFWVYIYIISLLY